LACAAQRRAPPETTKQRVAKMGASMSINISNFLSSIAAITSSITPQQVASVLSSAANIIGPSQAAQQLGRDLDLYSQYAQKGWGGDANAVITAENLKISASELTGLPSAVTNFLPMVWAAKDSFALLSAVGQVKTAAGLTS
jgi:hypothetical protein